VGLEAWRVRVERVDGSRGCLRVGDAARGLDDKVNGTSRWRDVESWCELRNAARLTTMASLTLDTALRCFMVGELTVGEVVCDDVKTQSHHKLSHPEDLARPAVKVVDIHGK